MIERKVAGAQWREVRAKLLGLPIEIVPVDQELAEMAGEIKAIKKMSLADCFAAGSGHTEKSRSVHGISGVSSSRERFENHMAVVHDRRCMSRESRRAGCLLSMILLD